MAAAGGAVYLSIMISTVVFSWQTDRLTFAAACVFALSDLMLIFNAAVNAGVLMRTAALLVYYISLLIYGCSLWKRSI